MNSLELICCIILLVLAPGIDLVECILTSGNLKRLCTVEVIDWWSYCENRLLYIGDIHEHSSL